jgi:hypothetical protein
MSPKSLKNLRRPAKGEKPRKADGTPAVSPGRPRTADLRADILADYERHGKAFIPMLRRKRPDLYCFYGFGKPVDTLQVGGIPGQPVQVEDISGLSIPELQQRLAVLKAKGEASGTITESQTRPLPCDGTPLNWAG